MSENEYIPFPAEIIEILKHTSNEFSFKVQCDLKAEPGQFFEVSLPTIGEAPLSISGIGDGWLDFTVRAAGKLTGAILGLNIGEKIHIRGPYGVGFPMEDLKGKHLVIAAGGSGVAPVRPIIEHIYNNPAAVDQFDLLLGFRDPHCVLFEDDIKRWEKQFNTIVTVDETCGIWDRDCSGLITKYVKSVRLSEAKKMEVIIVGPPIMMKFTAKEFIEHGVEPERIIVSFERHMSCGLGKCGHCKIDDTYICVDGPVFRYTDVKKLID